MKTHAILAALVLAAPATTLAGHRGPIFFPGACVPPPPAVCPPGFADYLVGPEKLLHGAG
jgi:hypothetical protein